MRAVVQRVIKSDVSVEGTVIGTVGCGLMVLIGVEDGDTEKDADYIAEKIMGLRIFEDNEGKMNLSLSDVGGAILAVSQFTLLGDCRKGRRPSFIKAARPELADPLFEAFITQCKGKGVHVEKGIFQANMLVRIENDGPVTVLVDSRKNF